MINYERINMIYNVVLEYEQTFHFPLEQNTNLCWASVSHHKFNAIVSCSKRLYKALTGCFASAEIIFTYIVLGW